MKQFLLPIYVDPRYLIFLRVGTGMITGFSFLAIWQDFLLFYGPSGMIDTELLYLQQTHRLISFQDIIGYVQAHFLLDIPTIQTCVSLLYLVLCALLAVGLFTRISSLLLLLLHGSIFTALPQLSYGFDYFCTITLFYCLLFPTNRYASIDRRLFHLSPSKWAGPCLRVLQLHLCLVYFFGGFDKALGHTWRNGEAIWKALHLPYFNQGLFIDVDALAPYTWLFMLMGWAVLLIELLYPLFIWLHNTRKAYLLIIVLLHLGIAVVLNLYLFSAIMIMLNLAAFYFDLPTHEHIQTTPKPPPTNTKTANNNPISPLSWWPRNG